MVCARYYCGDYYHADQIKMALEIDSLYLWSRISRHVGAFEILRPDNGCLDRVKKLVPFWGLYSPAVRVDEDRLYYDVGLSRHTAQCQASGTRSENRWVADCENVGRHDSSTDPDHLAKRLWYDVGLSGDFRWGLLDVGDLLANRCASDCGIRDSRRRNDFLSDYRCWS